MRIKVKKSGKYPTITELAAACAEAEKLVGKSLPIIGGNIRPETSISHILILNSKDTDWYEGQESESAAGLFLEG